VKINTIFLK